MIRSLPAYTEGPYLRTILCDLADHYSDSAGDNDGGLYRSSGFRQIRPEADHGSSSQDKEIAIFNVDGNICAIADTCPHAGGSLGMGKLDGKIVICPVHGMKFDVTNGCFAGTSDFGVASYPVKVVDGEIMVAVLANEKTR